MLLQDCFASGAKSLGHVIFAGFLTSDVLEASIPIYQGEVSHPDSGSVVLMPVQMYMVSKSSFTSCERASSKDHRGGLVAAYQSSTCSSEFFRSSQPREAHRLAIAFGILVTSGLEIWIHPSESCSWFRTDSMFQSDKLSLLS